MRPDNLGSQSSEAHAGTLEFTPLDGDDDVQFWYHLTVWHGWHAVDTTCEHELFVSRCLSCNAPIQIGGSAECEHLIAALDDIPVGQASLLTATSTRVDRVADGVPRWHWRKEWT